MRQWKTPQHVRSDCVRETADYGVEVDCDCPPTCKVCFPPEKKKLKKVKPRRYLAKFQTRRKGFI